MRAVTFQSIDRTSSPGSYSRTSSNSMPWPRKTEWYSPASCSFTRRPVQIRIVRTCFINSVVSIGMAAFPVAAGPRG
jgi:hypothetical protein